MKPENPMKYCVTTIIATSLFLCTGCQSGIFKKPDLGKLAFWKKDNLMLASKDEGVPPPSSRFSPDRDSSVDEASKQRLKESVNDIIAEARRNQSKPKDPIRQPYSLDAIDGKVGASGSQTKSNSFVQPKKMNQLQSATDQAFKAAAKTQQFAENTVKQSSELIGDTANSFKGWKKDIKSAGQTAASGLKQQTSDALNATADAVNDFAAATGNAVTQSVSNVADALDNSFQPRRGNRVASNPASPGTSSSGILSPKPPTTNAAATSTVQQSSFNSTGSAVLQPAGLKADPISVYPSTPFGEIQPRSGASQIGSSMTTDQMAIPAQLLEGNGTFSPGSTTPLKPATSAK